MHELQAEVKGKVQGVRFRDYVQTVATELGIKGYVRNVSDGTVYVVAQGEQDALKALMEHLHEGSVLSVVESVSGTWATPRTTYYDFSVL